MTKSQSDHLDTFVKTYTQYYTFSFNCTQNRQGRAIHSKWLAAS